MYFRPDLYFFIISFLLLNLGFVCSSFCNSFMWYVRLFIWDFSGFFQEDLFCYELLRTAFASLHRLCIGSIFIVDCLKVFLYFQFLIFSLTHWFYSSMLLSFQLTFFFLNKFFPCVWFLISLHHGHRRFLK